MSTDRKERNSSPAGASTAQVWTPGRGDGSVFPGWYSPVHSPKSQKRGKTLRSLLWTHFFELVLWTSFSRNRVLSCRRKKSHLATDEFWMNYNSVCGEINYNTTSKAETGCSQGRKSGRFRAGIEMMDSTKISFDPQINTLKHSGCAIFDTTKLKSVKLCMSILTCGSWDI